MITYGNLRPSDPPFWVMLLRRTTRARNEREYRGKQRGRSWRQTYPAKPVKTEAWIRRKESSKK